MITIIDYGMGNLGSIKNMFKRIGVKAQIESEPDVIFKSEKILLPGVGSFDNAMKRIVESNLKEVLDHKALKEGIPVLGICLGMQLLTNASEEGSLPGLGWINATTKRFPPDSGYKVPHMGWNMVRSTRDCALTQELGTEPRFYFVHSYYVKVDEQKDSILKANYGVEFDAAINGDNVYGAQFHPEKSHKFGMKLLENFARL